MRVLDPDPDHAAEPLIADAFVMQPLHLLCGKDALNGDIDGDQSDPLTGRKHPLRGLRIALDVPFGLPLREIPAHDDDLLQQREFLRMEIGELCDIRERADADQADPVRIAADLMCQEFLPVPFGACITAHILFVVSDDRLPVCRIAFRYAEHRNGTKQ